MAIFRHIFKYIWICLLFLCSCLPGIKDDINKNDFITPPSTVIIHAWWHWIDGAITKVGITKDLEAMHQQDISQATILNVGLFV